MPDAGGAIAVVRTIPFPAGVELQPVASIMASAVAGVDAPGI